MAAMSLRLFRTTGYSTLLYPGETRVATHPAWLVAGVSLWLGLACNVELWRLAAGTSSVTLTRALVSGALVAAASGLVLSLLGWRRTLKATATLLLFAGAVVASGLWVQDLPLEGLWTLPARRLLPAWPNLLGWQLPALLAALGLLPAIWVWQAQLRRLAGPVQLRSNLLGMALCGTVLAAGGILFPWF